MEYANHLQEYAPAPTTEKVAELLASIKITAEQNMCQDVYRTCLSALDLTTLSCCDNAESVTAMARRAAEFDIDYPHLQNVASICVFPPFVESVGLAIDGTSLRITSVAGGFPASRNQHKIRWYFLAARP